MRQQHSDINAADHQRGGAHLSEHAWLPMAVLDRQAGGSRCEGKAHCPQVYPCIICAYV